jgi:hypothetical protein
LIKQKPVIVRNIALPGKLYPLVDLHFSYVEREDKSSDVLIMFEPRASNTGNEPGRQNGKNRSRRKKR